ncbi:MAG TPA: crotonase/enoyl-CoA hydratase family protein [Candidatus Nitrosotalea sp.]|nr:crotonase/enoyl-CoA hydratase family protein [Candidatus Nitrosotalea sp.]
MSLNRGVHNYRDIDCAVGDDILTISLNRPERLNAVTESMLDEIIDAFDMSDSDDRIRAVVVTGRGRAFCAGSDLSAGGDTFDPTTRGGASRPEDHRDSGGRLALRIYESLKPVIAAVNGSAVGVGATMTLPMDIRLAADTARFGFVFSRRGIVPDACSSWFLPRVVGISKAVEWASTGRIFGAADALDAGLVRSVHAPEDLLPAAYAIAREIADNTSAVSVSLTRQMMWRMLGASHPFEAHRVDSALMFAMGQSEDAREGVSSFLEKRAPHFPMKVSTDMPLGFPWWKPESA